MPVLMPDTWTTQLCPHSPSATTAAWTAAPHQKDVALPSVCLWAVSSEAGRDLKPQLSPQLDYKPSSWPPPGKLADCLSGSLISQPHKEASTHTWRAQEN